MTRIADYFDKNYVIDATYDPDTNRVILELAMSVLLEEDALKLIILGIDKAAQGKRGNINWPTSEKEFVDFSAIQPKLRKDTESGNSETQIEYIPQFVLWLKYPDLRYANTVNPVD